MAELPLSLSPRRYDLAHRLANWIALRRSQWQPSCFNRAIVQVPETVVIRIEPYLVKVLVWRSESDEWLGQLREGTICVDIWG